MSDDADAAADDDSLDATELMLYDAGPDAYSWDSVRATCEVTGQTLATGDIQFQPDDDDRPTITLASFTPSELVGAAQDCTGCTVVPADEGYSGLCETHRAEAMLTALARGVL